MSHAGPPQLPSFADVLAGSYVGPQHDNEGIPRPGSPPNEACQTFQVAPAGDKNVPEPSAVACKACSSSFPSAHDFTTHIDEIHLGPFGAACPVCGKRYFRRSRLDRHLLEVHLKRVVWRCPVCLMALPSADELLGHARVAHTGRGPLQCLCGREFEAPAHLGSHVRSAHGCVLGRECPRCGKEMPKKELGVKLYMHLRVECTGPQM
ncbi:hypothetical protein NKR23_g6520 [Pleurostoma richardsiae]|uniref:C2H2-type domain-containing protein n=1 Tax=Pleurostoma richardsiae TaxID=41990 RepID=A0AA38VP30_9PEZI|nr:hypothetical protein NKR23_g6520 [Pleurostoma richardsiae]